MRIITFLWFLSLFAGLWASDKDERPKPPRPIEGVTIMADLKYLPDDRYSGETESLRGDYELLMDLYIPRTGRGPFPVVFYVHGGSWSGGSKVIRSDIVQEFTRRSIAVCSLNYMLRPKGVWPQVYWDFHNAARFLRKNADQYHLDPLRFGAYGISAGGWLISIASMPDGDHWQTGHSRAQTTTQIQAHKGGQIIIRKDEDRLGPYGIFKPIHDPAPAWPGESGGFSALAWDFSYCVEYGDASSPSFQQWTGLGHLKPDGIAAHLAAGRRLTVTELTHPKYAGQGVHVPPFYGVEAAAMDLEGKPGKTLGQVMADFFVRELASPTARPPAPEIYPIPRIISGPTLVTMVAPRGVTIRYTTDGSDPTPAGQQYRAAFSVSPGTTVKAISVADGMTPSGVHSAEFVAGVLPPVITGPATLPPGKTGEPYALTFTCDKPRARWQIAGDLSPYVPFQKKELVFPCDMHFDQDTGVWSGTPSKPGSYWIQVWAAESTGMMAGYRNYRWTVGGRDLGGKTAVKGESTDRNQDFASLKKWPAAEVTALLDAYARAKLRVVSPNAAGDEQVMLVVHADDRAKALALLQEFAAKHAALAKGVSLPQP